METLVIYSLIGALLCFGLEKMLKSDLFKNLISQNMSKKGKNTKDLIEFNNITRTVIIITWPICLTIFLYNFFKQFFK